MSLRRAAKWISFPMLFCLLAWYDRCFLGEVGEDMLVCTWNFTFRRLDGICIYWVTMRLTAWVMIYLHLLRLESGFSVYLFLRQKSYRRVFAHTYAGGIGIALCYYGVGTLFLAICHGTTLRGVNAMGLLRQANLPQILAEEGLEALSFCLTAYVVHCLFRKAEIGFLTVLAGRVVLNFITGGARLGLPVQLVVNLVMMGLMFRLAFHNFTEKFIEG